MPLPDNLEPIARVLGRKLARVSKPTQIRWVLHGLVSPITGEKVKLRAWRIGERWLTTPECVDQFLEATSKCNVGADVPVIRSTAQRNRASEAAREELAAMGL